jgi:hypothetical protein
MEKINFKKINLGSPFCSNHNNQAEENKCIYTSMTVSRTTKYAIEILLRDRIYYVITTEKKQATI